MPSRILVLAGLAFLLDLLGCKTAPAGAVPSETPFGCVPLTCTEQGANCGLAPDGCGGFVECGECTPPEVCGGLGTPNQCGCPRDVCPCVPDNTRELCLRQGAECGPLIVRDLCGAVREVDCGPCEAPQLCGGGGFLNRCGCVGERDEELCAFHGHVCGLLEVEDRCKVSRAVDCGGCPEGWKCDDVVPGRPRVCVCDESDEELCARHDATCGLIDVRDACGVPRQAWCGECAPSEVCGGGGVPHQCAPPLCSAGGFCWDRPLPQGRALNDVWGSSARDVWAVGPSGTVLHFDGERWASVPAGNADWIGVWGTSARDVWLLGSRGELARWDGEAWTEAVLGGHDLMLSDLSGTSATDVWVAGASGRAALLLHWDGVAWTRFDGPEDAGLYAVFALSENRAWAVGNVAGAGDHPLLLRWDGNGWSTVEVPWRSFEATGIWASSDSDLWVSVRPSGEGASSVFHWDGERWTEVGPPSGVVTVRGLHGRAADDLWAVGDSGVVLHWDGSRWTQRETRTVHALRGVWAHAQGAFVCGEGGALLEVRLEPVPLLPDVWHPAGLNALWGPAPNSIEGLWAAGDGGAMYRLEGSRWTPVPTPVKDDLYALWGEPGAPRPWAVGAWGTVLSPAGETGTVVTGIPTRQHLRGISGRSSEEVWIVGDSGTVLGFDGQTWSLALVDTSADLYAVWTAPDGTAWAVGAEGTLLRWNDEWWSAMKSPVQTTLRSVWGSAPDAAWAVGDQGTLLRWDGSEWTVWPEPVAEPSLHAVRGEPTGRSAWAVGELGVVLRFFGGTWLADTPAISRPETLRTVWSADQPTVAAGDKGVALKLFPRSSENLRGVNSVTEVRAIGEDRAGIYAVDNAGTIRRRNRGGWERVSTPACRELTSVVGTPGAEMWAICEHDTPMMRWNGSRWERPHLPSGMRPYAVWGDSRSGVWVSTWDDPQLFRWTEHGWENVGHPAEDLSRAALSGTAADDVWAVTYHTVLRWDGTQLHKVESEVIDAVRTACGFQNVFAFARDNVWVGGCKATAHWDGSRWRRFDFPWPWVGTHLCAEKDGKPWAVGWSGTILRFDGEAWQPVVSGTEERLHSCAVAADGSVWVAGSGGTIMRRN